ncbi:MAG: DUF1295 domain-containing protein [Actinobacteria bacterium]|nr:DUF1295 domain-containing protein [Actinomycetota bacterium]
MNKSERNALPAFPLVVLIGAGVAVAGSQGGAAVGGIPVFALCVGLAFVIQWLAFVSAYLQRNEGFCDLAGSLTYVTVAVVAVAASPDPDARAFLLAVLVVIWAVRLGSYLGRRIRKAGKDDRFDEIKTSFPRFLIARTVQGPWVTLTLAAALAAITTTEREELGVAAYAGPAIWVVGIGIEATADYQKSRFRADPAASKGRFIHSGLWYWSRHPNYFGEIVLWVGVAVIAAPVLQGWQWATMISPVFVAFLLIRVSGIPMLEKKADQKWGGQEDYEAYKSRTSVLVPLPPGRRADARRAGEGG